MCSCGCGAVCALFAFAAAKSVHSHMYDHTEFTQCYVHGMPRHAYGSLKRVTASLQRINRLPACVQALEGMYRIYSAVHSQTTNQTTHGFPCALK